MSDPVEVASRAESVTLFEDRAEVRRRAQVQLPAGVSTVRVAGLSVVVDDGSLLAAVAGSARGVRVLDARIVRRAVPVAESTKAVPALEAELEAARARAELAEAAVERSIADQTRAVSLSNRWIEAIQRAPGTPSGSESPASSLSPEALDDALIGALDDAAARRLELQRATTELSRAEQRLAQARAANPRFEALAEIQLEASAPASLELELTYRTPCALWRPEHQAQLVIEAGKAHLVVRTWATAWQRTGEDWTDVKASFSTARPSGASSPPLLADDVLELRRKAPEDKKTVTVEAREQTIQVAGVAQGTRQVAEMPGVDDGGEPLRLEAPHPVTLPGDGRAFRVDLFERVVDCQVDCIAFPERSVGAFVRGTATWFGPEPLLAGPVWAGRGKETMGLSRTRFVAPGEPFELGFGVDDGLRVRRTQEEKRETVAITSAQRVTRTVKLWCSNLSGERKTLKLTERVPVSEIADLEVKLLDAGDGRFDPKDGLVRYELRDRAALHRHPRTQVPHGSRQQRPAPGVVPPRLP